MEWPYIHKGMVWYVSMYGKRENHLVPSGGGGGFSFLPGPHAQLDNHKTTGGISCSTGWGGRGECTMTSTTHRSTRVHDRIPWGEGRAGGRMEQRLSRRACTQRECYIYTDTWCVCACVYISQSKREWPYIHKDMVCMCVYGKREKHPVPRGGGSPSSLARTHS